MRQKVKKMAEERVYKQEQRKAKELKELVRLPKADSDDCLLAAPWKDGIAYEHHDQVIHHKKLYEAKWWTKDEKPEDDLDDGVWEMQGSCLDWE